jgi:GAF domain-containing protein
MLAAMALELEADRSPDQVLGKVCQYARVILDCDDAGIMLTKSRRDVETPAATGPKVDEAHQLQATYDEGSCLDAIEGRATYVSNDLENDPRWPQWGPAAAKLGYRSTLGVRLATRDRGYGSLNVYAERLDAFDDDSVQICEMLAAHATVAFASADREVGLITALDSRTTIGQAQGILMQKFDIDADAAFQFLKRLSQHQNQKLVQIADAIVVQRTSNVQPE